MSKLKKHDIITFKIDETLKEFMSEVDNRSEYIRKAILKSFEDQCPLCKGSGHLTKQEHAKWRQINAVFNTHAEEDNERVLQPKKEVRNSKVSK